MSGGTTYDVVVCGAGIAGVAVAHALAVQQRVARVLLVDERPPLTLTSDKSTEAYRNWWPGPDEAMVHFMNRSIDLLEQWSDASGDRFLLNRRGYFYATARAQRAALFEADATIASLQGAGPVRTWTSISDAMHGYRPSADRGWRDHPSGADLFLGRDVVRAQFPWLHDDICAVLHARRCGWFSGQQLGMWLLQDAKSHGVELCEGRVRRVLARGGRIAGVTIDAADGTTREVSTPAFVNAAGPYARAVGEMAAMALPLFSEAHYKVALDDVAGVVPRGTGLVILDDAQELEFSDEERAELAADPATQRLTGTMPAGVHLRPEGYGDSHSVLLLWDYHSDERFDEPMYPMHVDPFYPEVVLRGMTRLVPGLAAYLDRVPSVEVDGGYYTKTLENRPLIGAAGHAGAFACCGFSGYGLMAAPAAAEMVAAQVCGAARPSYETAFLPSRFDDPAYLARLATWGSTGQL